MKKNSILKFIVLVFISTQFATAQVDQVSVGALYAYQAYYKLSTGEVTQIDNNAWDIAFSNEGRQDAGVFINESTSLTGTPLELYITEYTDWMIEIQDTSLYVDSLRLYNPDVNWTEGAFNSIKDSMNHFDYGWGEYNPNSHSLQGDKIFIIKKRDSSFIKMQIQELINGEYVFRYADLDGSHEVNAIVSRTDAEGVPLLYFSLETDSSIVIPNDYDLVFQRYNTRLDDGEEGFLDYNVTGVLSHPGVSVAKAVDVDPENVVDTDFSYSSSPTAIGYDWKVYDFELGWLLVEDLVYFVKTTSGEKYMIQFYDFEGASSGTTTLNKTKLTPSANKELSIDDEIEIYPNPFTNYLQIRNQHNELFNISIVDIEGKTVWQQSGVSNEQINIPSILPKGAYYITLRNKANQVFTKKLIK